jgi:nucleoside-triphosphatase THEP1
MVSRSVELSEKWIKASVLGALWAASEIVLGSFIHNLRIPFGSNLLTGIAIVLMISTSYLWKEKGLFWRAGVICALMKTISPSAVIFGPMVAIFSQAMLLEVSVRVMGRTIAGFITGAMLAMSWNLFQKIANYIIFYGFNIVEVYAELLRMAQEQLGIAFEIVWLPVLFLLLAYWILGILFAAVGIRTGRRLVRQKPVKRVAAGGLKSGDARDGLREFSYSVWWLLLNFLLMVTMLLLFDRAEWYIWGVAVPIVASVWVLRYRRAMRQLMRPRFWISFVIITMITAFVFNRMQSLDIMNGVLIGVRMNFRAVIMILGFTVLGTELYNPTIRDYFLRSAFRQLPLALELSFKSLPMMIAGIPEARAIRRDPVSVIYNVVSQIEFRLEEVKSSLANRIFIITGAVGSGKSSVVAAIVEALREKGVAVGGIMSPRVMAEGRTVGYDVTDIMDGRSFVFLREGDDESLERVGRYRMMAGGLAAGREALERAYERGDAVVVADEVGRLELGGGGWSAQLERVTAGGAQVMVMAVRDAFWEEVVRKFRPGQYEVLDVRTTDKDDIVERVVAGVSGQ